MVSQVMEQVNRRLISYTSYSSATREHTRSKAKNKHKVALMTCIFFLLVTFALAIFFWLSRKCLVVYCSNRTLSRLTTGCLMHYRSNSKLNKTSQYIDLMIKLLRRQPGLCIFIPCIAFEAPAAAYFTHAGKFYELLIIFGLLCIQPIVYFAVCKSK